MPDVLSLGSANANEGLPDKALEELVLEDAPLLGYPPGKKAAGKSTGGHASTLLDAALEDRPLTAEAGDGGAVSSPAKAASAGEPLSYSPLQDSPLGPSAPLRDAPLPGGGSDPHRVAVSPEIVGLADHPLEDQPLEDGPLTENPVSVEATSSEKTSTRRRRQH